MDHLKDYGKLPHHVAGSIVVDLVNVYRFLFLGTETQARNDLVSAG